MRLLMVGFSMILLAIVSAGRLQAAELRLVLVANSQSSISQLSVEEARRLYFGVPIEFAGKAIKPLRNETDSLLREVFMQQVMFMTASAYERLLLSRTYQTGTSPPPAYTDMRALVAALKADSQAVTYMFIEIAVSTPGIKIVAQLWKGQD